ncbi:efflux RND transporter periplasmic adaptor subunit [Azonexus sp.]|jgi:cobalt-zinc-cadmium efflux system membrane fusion protein|uniref:efflux RND transporter periplasmic adaptor subunit n=1 Tax=Azonexus sp. TaxID=1872668 RepID=UPI002831CB91|nr:efflux RND transporter periplasmic adaptor subunit [Azonexus sp.]MDR1994805.1 efflux RND transporter periplasmic adaptor subunit [Azonexus sp.]
MVRHLLFPHKKTEMKLQPYLGYLFVGCLIGIGGIFLSVRYSGTENQLPQALAAPSPNTVSITEKQRQHISVGAVTTRTFVPHSEAVGYVDFNQDRSVQVFAPWAGRIRQVLVQAGDAVKRGQMLFLIESADLIQAESTLISAAGQLKQAQAAKERAQGLLATQAVAQKDYEQAVADEQNAAANYRAAHAAIRQFGKTDKDIDALVASRKIDGILPIASPLAGQITARNATEGLFVQPGDAPAPIAVSDTSSLWLIANVPETELPKLRLGQAISATIAAYPERSFDGHITHIGSAVDSDTHTVAVRADIRDPEHLLRAQMMASFRIQTSQPMQGVAVPPSALVREGDGTMTVFVARDNNTFERRVVRTGLQQNDFVHITQGLSPEEKIATDGALFLSNALALQTR